VLKHLTEVASRGPVSVLDDGRWLVREPELIREVLVTRRANYTKDTPVYIATRGLFGEGLLNASGPAWRARRDAVQPAFRGLRLEGLLKQTGEELVAELGAGSSSRNLAEPVRAATARVLTRALFGEERQELALRWSEVVTSGQTGSVVLEELRHVLAAEPATPMLQALAAHLSGEALVHEVATLMFAGTDTTASSILWTLHLLAQHGDVDFTLGDSAARRRILHEALRLYPPAWALSRRVVSQDTLGGVDVPAGAEVVVSPWVTQRLPSLWQDPERFDPSRFVRPPKPFSWFPFLGGPRRCIGAAMAEQEALVLLDAVLSAFRLRPHVLFPVSPEAGLTLRPRGGLWMLVEPRS
jgi:enediyne biosynthesis protein E7